MKRTILLLALILVAMHFAVSYAASCTVTNHSPGGNYSGCTFTNKNGQTQNVPAGDAAACQTWANNLKCYYVVDASGGFAAEPEQERDQCTLDDTDSCPPAEAPAPAEDRPEPESSIS